LPDLLRRARYPGATGHRRVNVRLVRTSGIQAELVVDARAALGEGPVWDEREQCLWWVDIMSKSVHRTKPADLHDDVYAVGQFVGSLALRESSGLVLALGEGFATLDTDNGAVELIAPVESDDATTRMNDGKVDPAGRFWAGTMGVDHRANAGTLYRLDADWRVTPMVTPVTISNGLDWSLDGRTMYYIDTRTCRVDQLDYDVSTGSISNRRPFIEVPESDGSPDGMTIDAEGYLWVALWKGWAVHRYAPDGALDMRVDVPAAETSSCAFGGPDLDQLFITTAQEGFPPGGKPDQPHAGSLFVCRPGPHGRAPFRFAG
jgi:sugar lactone lactonase YvrE